ncbi:hypothetical protein JEQ21_02065 [Streptococcus sp. 121]|uniref:hypothetical protein n=1 Tax=Streptococcus sp. 121 TaxID=2797637 RepID=UPI0018F08EB1|nr:hypothetical protein [Streptococcus sp. 121]MBJ6745256.1 hypothetical protein [Streptococcus sp. 121]
MTKLYGILTKILQVVLLVLSLHWVLVAFLALGQPWWLTFPAALGLGFWIYRKPSFWKRIYDFLCRHKLAVIVVLTVFQILLLLSAQLLIRRDAAVVFLGAFKLSKPLSIASYLTRNPNNLPLFLYERWFYNLLGPAALWVMQGINILATNLSALILFKGTETFWGRKRADLVFLFYTALLVASPFFMAMYTDMLAFPFISLQFFFAMGLLKSNRTKRMALQLGLVTALAYLLRPTVLVTVLALFLILFFTKDWRKLLLGLSLFSLSFAVVHVPLQRAMDQQTEVNLVEGDGLAKTPLLFVNLGLTYSGTDQEDMKEGLLAYLDPEVREEYNNGMFAEENVKKEILRRIREYNFWTFTEHTVYKQSQTVLSGTLNWIYYEDVEREKTPYISPLYEEVGSQPFFTWIRRHFISFDRPEFGVYAWVKQVVWIALAWGIVRASRRYAGERTDLQFVLLAVLGGFLFLQVFEGGKTRYLIQFLPQILALSSLGWVRDDKHGKI